MVSLKWKICWVGAVLLVGCGKHLPNGGKGLAMYTFTYAPKVGETTQYKLTESGTSDDGKEFEVVSTLTTKVLKVEAGKSTVELTRSWPAGSSMKPVSSTEQIDSHGTVLSTDSGGGINPLVSEISITQGMPDHQVAEGNIWTVVQHVGKEPNPGNYKLLKVEDRGGVQVASIQIMGMKLPTSDGAMIILSKPGSVEMEPATGVLHSVSISTSIMQLARLGSKAPKRPPPHTITLEKQ